MGVLGFVRAYPCGGAGALSGHAEAAHGGFPRKGGGDLRQGPFRLRCVNAGDQADDGAGQHRSAGRQLNTAPPMSGRTAEQAGNRPVFCALFRALFGRYFDLALSNTSRGGEMDSGESAGIPMVTADGERQEKRAGRFRLPSAAPKPPNLVRDSAVFVYYSIKPKCRKASSTPCCSTGGQT